MSATPENRRDYYYISIDLLDTTYEDALLVPVYTLYALGDDGLLTPREPVAFGTGLYHVTPNNDGSIDIQFPCHHAPLHLLHAHDQRRQDTLTVDEHNHIQSADHSDADTFTQPMRRLHGWVAITHFDRWATGLNHEWLHARFGKPLPADLATP